MIDLEKITQDAFKDELEKIAKISGQELLTMALPIIPASIFAKNVAGDVSNKIAPFGVKVKSEKSARRMGMIGGGTVAALSALAMMRRQPQLGRMLSKYLEPEAIGTALTYGIPAAAIGAGWLSGYPIGAGTAGLHTLTMKREHHKTAAFIDELQKIAEQTQLERGIEVEKEHLPTVKKIQASIKDGKITMPNEKIYESIAEDHLNEEDNPKRKQYYTLLKKFVDPS